MDKIKEVIKKYFNDARYGIFFTRNLVGDPMTTIYSDDKYKVDICYSYAYFEVFGLNSNQQEELETYYNALFRSRLND